MGWFWFNQMINLLHSLGESGVAELIAVFLVASLIILYGVIYTVTIFHKGGKCWRRKGICSKGWSKSRVLITIAHPDDEAMFFGPTIRGLVRDGHVVYVLCFSYGDAAGLGLTRKAELWKSCRALGIRSENITIVKHDKLQDGMKIKWPILPLSAHISNFVHAYGIDAVVTFDDQGISGHLNHICVHFAAMDLIERNLLPKDCEVYTLKSVGFIRQYFLSLYIIPPLYCFNQFVYVARGYDYNRIVAAMKRHKSQMVWFRYLHVYLSTYMMINVLEKIPKPACTTYFTSSRRKYR